MALSGAIARKLLGDDNKVEFISVPARALVSTVQGSQVDLGLATIFDSPTTDALKQQVEVSEPFANGGVALIAKSGDSVGGLKDLKLAYVTAGRDYRPEFDAFARQQGLTTIRIEPFASYEEAATALERGQVQAVLGHTITHAFYLDQHPARFELAGKPLTTEQFAIIANKGERELLGIVNEVLQELKASGELLRLAQLAGFPVEAIVLP